jgi:hypothetical protein
LPQADAVIATATIAEKTHPSRRARIMDDYSSCVSTLQTVIRSINES